MTRGALSSREKLILSAIALDADIPIVELARALSLPSHVVRNSIDGLRRRQLISPRLFLDLYRTGLTEFSIYFSTVGEMQRRTETLQYLLSRPAISWAVETLGEFEYGCSGYFRSIEDFHALMQDVYDRYPGVIKGGSIATVLSVTDYGFAGGGPKSARTFRYGFSGQPIVELDSLDQCILSALSSDPGRSALSLAQELMVPQSTIAYRTARLRSQKVILGTQFMFSSATTGFMAYRIFLSCAGCSTADREKLEQLCREHPLVHFLVCLAGEWSFEVGVFARTAAEVNKLTAHIQELFGTSQVKARVLADSQLLKLSPYPFSPIATQRMSKTAC